MKVVPQRKGKRREMNKRRLNTHRTWHEKIRGFLIPLYVELAKPKVFMPSKKRKIIIK